MAKAAGHSKEILVYADWVGIEGPHRMGVLLADAVRGKEVFSFAYDPAWLQSGWALNLDPDLLLYTGPQYAREEKVNFGLFADSSPDRWGRMLMQRREALIARQDERKLKTLRESDYLLGVFDLYRMGGLRYKMSADGPFLDDQAHMAAPPITALRELEAASYELEKDDADEDPNFSQWLNMLFSPGTSLGGARPKASVIDEKGQLWIAKFPSRGDERDVGGWEMVVNEIGIRSGVNVAKGVARRLTHDYHTFLTKRFDRLRASRAHFASAMTLLGLMDGVGADSNVSYLHLAEFIIRYGAKPEQDLEELWKRIVFNICISNSDDHLRNHGFLLTEKGWTLSPAFDINPIQASAGLHLNITEYSNAVDLDLAREVSEQFRVSSAKRESIIKGVTKATGKWHELAKGIGIRKLEIESMESCFITTNQHGKT